MGIIETAHTKQTFIGGCTNISILNIYSGLINKIMQFNTLTVRKQVYVNICSSSAVQERNKR